MILNRLSVRLWTLCTIAALGVAGSVGCATVGPGCGGAIGCSVEPGCGCEPGCAVEPGCGCATSCGCDGRSMAGEMWCGDCGCGPRKPLINVCTGPDCCGGCEPGCGVASGCGCGVEPGCGVGGCGDACGCGSTCGSGCGCPLAENVAFGLGCIGSELRRVFSPLGLCCPNGGCGGCGELYWNEWHSDPPQCCDPCDRCGNWVGPSATSMRAPYEHEFSPRRVATLPGDGPVLR